MENDRRLTPADVLRSQRDNATQQLQDQEVELRLVRDQNEALTGMLEEQREEVDRLEAIIAEHCPSLTENARTAAQPSFLADEGDAS
jgi:septal ring factor EnvC (AmiA/AmiB activator)